MPDDVVVDCTTGEAATVTPPPEVLAERETARAAAEVERVRLDGLDANRTTIEQRARDALTANRDFLAVQSPTNAAVLAQVRMLTRECSALIRLMLSELDGTD